jgi:hypothetical protein
MVVIEHVPDAAISAVLPLRLQTDGVFDAKLTGNPELALAESGTDVVVLRTSLRVLKVIVCDCRVRASGW